MSKLLTAHKKKKKKSIKIIARLHDKSGKATKANVDDLVFGKKIKKLAERTAKAGTGKKKS